MTPGEARALTEAWITHRHSEGLTSIIPARITEAIVRYGEQGTPPGSFLEAVLANDLFRAVAKADAQSYLALEAILWRIANTLPIQSYGSYPKVQKWIETHREGVKRG